MSTQESSTGPAPTETSVESSSDIISEESGEASEQPETAPAISAENLAEFTNTEVLEWYTVDQDRLTVLGSAAAREFVAERGGKVQEFDPESFLARQTEQGVISFSDLEQNDDGSYGDLIPLYVDSNKNLEIFVNTILANRDMFEDREQTRSGGPAMMLQATTENFLVDSFRDLTEGEDGYDQIDSYVIANLIDFALDQPEGTIVTNFGLGAVISEQGPTAHEKNGTWAVVDFRNADGSEERVGGYRLSEGMPSAYVIDHNGNMATWNKYTNEGQEAYMLWDSERRFASE